MQHGRPRQGVLTQEPLAVEPFIKAFDAELDYLFASLRRLGARPEEMEDLAHQVFLGLLRSRPTFDSATLLSAPVVRPRGPGHRKTSAPPFRKPGGLRRIPSAETGGPGSRSAEASCCAGAARAGSVPLEKIAGSLSMTRLGVAVRLRKARREMEAAVRQPAADWQAGRFGRPDLLLATLGIGNRDVLNMSKSRARAEPVSRLPRTNPPPSQSTRPSNSKTTSSSWRW